MGWKYEVETYFHERGGLGRADMPEWEKSYQGNSRIKAELALWKARRVWPGRCHRLVIR